MKRLTFGRRRPIGNILSSLAPRDIALLSCLSTLLIDQMYRSFAHQSVVRSYDGMYCEADTLSHSLVGVLELV